MSEQAQPVSDGAARGSGLRATVWHTTLVHKFRAYRRRNVVFHPMVHDATLTGRVLHALIPWDTRKGTTNKFGGFYRECQTLIGVTGDTLRGWRLPGKRPGLPALERMRDAVHERAATFVALEVELDAEIALRRSEPRKGEAFARWRARRSE